MVINVIEIDFYVFDCKYQVIYIFMFYGEIELELVELLESIQILVNSILHISTIF